MTTTNFRGESVAIESYIPPKIVRQITLETLDGRYLGMVSTYAGGGYRHSIQRFGTPDFATLADAQFDFDETKKNLPEHVHAYLFAHITERAA